MIQHKPCFKPLSNLIEFSIPSSAIFNKYGVIILLIEIELILEYLVDILKYNNEYRLLKESNMVCY